MRLLNGAVLALAVFGACRTYDDYVPPRTNSGTGGNAGDGGEDPGGGGGQASGGRASDGKSGGGAGGTAGNGSDAGGAGADGESSAGGSGNKGGRGGAGGSGNAGSSGGSGSAGGSSGSAGSTSGAGSNDVAGAGGEGGGDPGDTELPPIVLPDHCSLDETLIPDCDFFENFPEISFPEVGHITVAPYETYGGFTVFGSQPDSSTVGVFWGDLNTWTRWLCFSVVPHPTRVAATRQTDDRPEVFAVTECGRLYARHTLEREGRADWSAWTEMRLPSGDSVATDVAATMSGWDVTYLYVADRGHVFVRHRVSADPFAAFGPWVDTGARRATTLTAGLRPDGRQQLFYLDDAGRPKSCRQTAAELDAPFEACRDFGAAQLPRLVELDAPLGPSSSLLVFGLDEDGIIWVRELGDTGEEFGTWRTFREQPFPFTRIATAGTRQYAGLPFLVLGVANGNVYGTLRLNDAWDDWRLFPPP